MENHDEIPFNVLREVLKVRHFLFVKKRNLNRGSEIIFYDASSEEEILRGQCRLNFFSVLEKKERFSKMDFFTKKGIQAFSFKRNLFSQNLNLILLKKNKIAVITPKNLFSSNNNQVCHFEKRGENLEFYNDQKQTIGMRRRKIPKKKFKPSGGFFPQRDYDGEVVFYDDALLPEIKIGLLGAVFL